MPCSRVQLEHEVDQGPLQTCTGAVQDRETCTGNFKSPFQDREFPTRC